MQDKRQSIETVDHPSFIGCWTGIDPEICTGLIDFFEGNPKLQKQGRVSGGRVDETVKHSTDLRVEPNDLKNPGYEVFSTYFDQLQDCYRDYCTQWDFLNTFLDRIHIGAFNVQKYEVGGHFSMLHSERTDLTKLHRILVWMTYLNDVTDAGETEFPYYGLKVPPVTGKTLIWPAEWTHMHRGCPSGSQIKYIITGWFHFAQ